MGGDGHLTQFAEVANALAGARMRKGTTSAGYSQVMPSQPTAKKVLKRKRNKAATMPGPLPPSLSCGGVRRAQVEGLGLGHTMIASMTIEKDWPAAPNSMLPVVSGSQQPISKSLTADDGHTFQW